MQIYIYFNKGISNTFLVLRGQFMYLTPKIKKKKLKDPSVCYISHTEHYITNLLSFL